MFIRVPHVDHVDHVRHVDQYLLGAVLQLNWQNKIVMNKMAFNYRIVFLGDLNSHCLEAINGAKDYVSSLKEF